MPDQETISSLIKTFHLAITYLRIYPPTSQMVVATFDSFFKTAAALVEKNGSLTFSELSGKFLVDGKEAETREMQAIAGNILRVLTQRKIQSITVRAGVTKEELAEFVTVLLRKRRDEFPEFPHIGLDQTVYVAMVKGEEAVVKITDMVQGSGGDIGGLMKTIRESYDLIDQIGEPAGRAQAQERLAQELARQDPSVLREIFERELPPKIEQSGLKGRLLSALSQEKIQDIFGEISTWYNEVRKKEMSDFAAVEQLEKLKKFMQAVLSAPAARDVPRQFFEELIRKGLIEQLPEWFSAEPAKPATVFEVERLLEKPAVELLQKQTMDNLPQLAEKLCRIENNELLAKLLEKLLENFANTAAKVRLPAAQSALALYDVLQANGKEPLMRYLELPVLEAARKETSPEVHALFVEILCRRAQQNLLHGEYDGALRVFDLILQHSSPEVMPDEKIRTETAAAFRKLVADVIEILIADLKSDHDKKRLGALQIAAKTGDLAVEPLVRVIKESEDLRGRRLAAQALKGMGEGARKRFNEELNLGLVPDELKRVVEALADLGDAQTIEHLNSLLRYPDASVKKEIMKFLAKINTGQARVLLISQLRDEDPALLSEAVRLLGETKSTEAVPALSALLESSKSPATLQEEICISLGSIGSAGAVPSLIAKLRKRGGWFARKNLETERIRMRAAWALRRFTGPDVEQALEAASRDRVDAVALTARESLAVLRQGRETARGREG